MPIRLGLLLGRAFGNIRDGRRSEVEGKMGRYHAAAAEVRRSGGSDYELCQPARRPGTSSAATVTGFRPLHYKAYSQFTWDQQHLADTHFFIGE